MSRFMDLAGTVLSKFQLGIGGPQVKGAGGVVQARNAADSTYASLAAALFATYGDDFELNAGAAGSGADWTMTLRRPSSGMTHELIFVFPSADPSPAQALTVTSLVGDVVTLGYTTIAAGTDKTVVDTTSLAFGDSSPVTMFTKAANSIITQVQVIIDTPFDGTPTASVGIAGTTSKYLAATQIDLTAAAATVFDITPGLPAEVGSEALIITYSAGGASAGAARFLVSTVIPS